MDALNQINSNDYQAIIPIPYFHVGSEALGRPYFKYAYIAAPFALSYHTGLPLTSVFMSRTSIPETKASLILFSQIPQEKAIIKKMKKNLPLLILHMRDQTIPEDEKWLIKKAKKIFSNDKLSLYKINVSDLQVLEHIENKESMNSIYSNSYEDIPNRIRYHGKGSLQLNHYGINELFDYNQVQFKINQDYILRFWFENSGNRCQVKLKLGFFNDGIIQYDQTFLNAPNTYKIDGNWSLYEIKLK